MKTNYQYKISYVEYNDLDEWMDLVELVKDDFPGLDIDDYREGMKKTIERKTGIIARYDGRIVGLLIISKMKSEICFLAVHPDYRKKGIASELLKFSFQLFNPQSTIIVTTYREDDPKGIAPRRLYKSLGFREDELTIEYGYPTQRLIKYLNI